MKPIRLLWIFSLLTAFLACQNDLNQGIKPKQVDPTDLHDPVATLGRALFYDKILSADNSTSCGTCHKQELGFSDKVPFSAGANSQKSLRNSIPIMNLFLNPTPLFWDGRERLVENLVLQPIVNHFEMGMDNMDVVIKKIIEMPSYGPLFVKAYGSPVVDRQGISTALSKFILLIRSNNSKFDRLIRYAEPLSSDEMKGFKLFTEKYNCGSCHRVKDQSPNAPGYADGTSGAETIFANIGLDKIYSDNGLSSVTNNPGDAGKFRVPSLRNVALTAPYMHDGRYATLDEVIDHYKNGIANHPNLDARLRNPNGSPLQIAISDDEKAAVIAFLKTLTDPDVIQNPTLANPFLNK